MVEWAKRGFFWLNGNFPAGVVLGANQGRPG
jgi:hypothetical protein